MEFGTFLLLQSPGARSSEEVFSFGTRIAQEADKLGFGSVWCAEHHFSTYGYLSRPLMFATPAGRNAVCATPVCPTSSGRSVPMSPTTPSDA